MKTDRTAEQRTGDAKISIVVPVYNTQDWLCRCIDSILSGTYQNFELLLIDDGSTDDSPAIADAYAEKDARVRVLHLPNGGVSAARNRGIEAATGDYIGFVDSDDWTEPTYLEYLLAPFRNDPDLCISICGWYIHRNDQVYPGTDRGLGKLTPEDAIREALDISHGFHGYLWNKLFRADLFRTGPQLRLDPDLHICEDLLLCVKAFASGATAYDGGEPLYHYNWRPSSALRTMDDRRMSEYVARERIAALLTDRPSLYRAAELAHVKAALNLLAEAKQRKDRDTARALKSRIDARLGLLLRAKDIARFERIKLPVRRAFPVWSLRVFRGMRDGGKA